jgi:tight adherence protein B
MIMLAIVMGMLTGWGLWLFATGARRIERPTSQLVYEVRAKLTSATRIRLLAAAGTGLLILVATRWPVAALIGGLFAWAAPALLGGNRREAHAQAKLDAIASWTEAMRGRLRSYAGIEQAIRESADQAKPPIHAQTVGLSAALTAGVRLPDALASFQADIDHHAADLVAASLRQASTRRGGNLAGQLAWLSTAVRERVAARQRIETARAEAKSSARIVILIVAAVGIGLFLFNRPLLAPYDQPGGQIVLLLVGGIWTLATIYLQKLTRLPEQTRVLQAPSQREPS